MELESLAYVILAGHSALIEVALTLLVIAVGIMSGVMAFIVRKIWKIQTEDIPALESDVNSLSEQFRGSEDQNDLGFTGLTQQQINEMQEQMDDIQEYIEKSEERRREEHREVRQALKTVIGVLEDHDFNGDLPNKEDLD